VTWLGQRVVDPAAVQKPAKAMPVRIRAVALGENLPQRDLLVSPDTACSLTPGCSPPAGW
jgi:hypothetical protein